MLGLNLLVPFPFRANVAVHLFPVVVVVGECRDCIHKLRPTSPFSYNHRARGAAKPQPPCSLTRSQRRRRSLIQSKFQTVAVAVGSGLTTFGSQETA